MKFNKNWTTIVEVIVVMLIVVVWIIWASNIYQKSQDLTISTQNRLIAIDIAREWIEAVTNIRDTNWILFSANTNYCWNVLDYNANCLTSTDQTNNIIDWSYNITLDINNRWKLNKYTWSIYDYKNNTYQNHFKIKKDANWLYTQWTWTDFKPLFTREIKITYINSANPENEMKVESIVKWVDKTKNTNYELKLETMLTNWQK